MEIGRIAEIVADHRCRHVVITGGEPMIAPGIHDLCSLLSARGHHITIETAGTVSPNNIACDLASLSPKLQNATPLPGEISEAWILRHDETRHAPEIVREWLGNYTYQLKFVLTGESDLPEIEELLIGYGNVLPEDVLLMAEGITSETLGARSLLISDICRRKGFRYSPRLHIDLFGNTKGT
jgi:7-carboxy-7-deazaguanine synthase